MARRKRNAVREIVAELGGVTRAAQIADTSRMVLYNAIDRGCLASALIARRLLEAADRENYDALLELMIKGGEDGRRNSI